jgi:hypothetical protein
MDIAAILALIEKGLTVVGAIVEAGQEAAPAIKALTELVTGARQGTVTDDQIAQCEALLDKLVADFNIDIS